MKQTKRLLSLVLVIAMLVGFLPTVGGWIPNAQAANEPESTEEASNTDPFGIEMAPWTEAQEKAAEANAPLGGGMDSSTSVMTFSELYISGGYDRKTWRTGLFDWSPGGNTQGNAAQGVADIRENSLKHVTSNGYKFVDTAAMDMNGSGKDEYVANLAYTSSGSKLQLFITDGNGNIVTNTVLVASGPNIDQIDKLSTYQIRGAIAVAAGDFDGDGVDSILVYIPALGANPCIWQYKVENGRLVRGGDSVTEDLFVTLDLTRAPAQGFDVDSPNNQPLVHMVAEDVDRDGYDELILTAGTNDWVQNNSGVATTAGRLGSQLFVYDEVNGAFKQTYHVDLSTKSGGTAAEEGRIVWASSTVGNMVIDSGVDYPEIVAAGYVDNNKGYDIEVPHSDDIGAVVVGVDPSSPISNGSNVQAKYYVKSQQTLKNNTFTENGFYEDDECNNLMAVQAFADRGLNQVESVFISGSVFRCDANGRLSLTAVPGHFQGSVDSVGGTEVTNTIVQTVTAGNFNGNREGREQIICAVSLRQSGHNNSWSDVIIVYNRGDDGNDEFTYRESDPKEVGFPKRDCFYITVNALDVDDDSLVLTLTEMKREYSEPDVMAILEAPPYFAEINGGDTGNSATNYGTSKSTETGTSESTGFSAGITVGYEVDGLFFGGGAETSINTSFTSSTASSQSEEWGIEYSNDAGDNLVVVYRCPVACYRYVDQNGEEIVIFRSEEPATSMIPVEEYNELAPQFGLEPISDDLLGEPGNPFSYRSSTASLNGVIDSVVDAQVSPNGWVQYYGQGTVTQSLETGTATEETFEYGLDVSVSVWGKAGGAKAGVQAGYSESHSETTVNGSSVSKSGAVTSQQVEGYDFQWKFVAFQYSINDNTVPVLGYLVQGVVAPPSPPVDLTVDDVTSDSLTLSWDLGDRVAQQYRIYRVLEESSMPYVQVASVAGNVQEYTITGLNPGSTYTYVVRAVGYDDFGAEQISVDSSPVTARTTTDGTSGVTVTLTPSSGQISSNGQTATVTANVYNPSSGGTYYRWQIRTPGGDRWVDLKNGDGTVDGIGSVSGASAATLNLQNIDASLDGSSLRCVVIAPTSDATPEYYYSTIATLTLKGDNTTTRLTLTGGGTAAGTSAEPYTGLADYKAVTKVESITNQMEPVKQENYTIYTYLTNPGAETPTYNYVGVKNDTSGTSYVKVTKNGDVYAIGDPLTSGQGGYYYNNNGNKTAYEVPEGFDGSALAMATVTTGDGEEAVTTTYYRSYRFTGGKPTEEYWFNEDDGKYYTRAADDEKPGTYTYTVLADDQQPGEDDDVRRVYSTTAGSIVVDANTDIYEGDTTALGYGYYKYEVYTGAGSEASATTFWYEADTGLYYETQDSSEPPQTIQVKYADSAGLDAVMEMQSVPITTEKTTSQDGTQITLSAAVANNVGGGSVSTTVDYLITHLATGSKTTLSAASGSSVTWTAAASGLYEITATSRSTLSTLSSSDTCYYYARAVAPADTEVIEYRLLVKNGGNVVSSATYSSGAAYSLTLERRKAAEVGGTPGEWTAVNENVSYTVNNQALTNASYTPTAAGSYSFAAKVGNDVVSTAVLTIAKRNVTVMPSWEGDTPANLSDITVKTEPAISDTELANAFRVSCGLFGSDGSIQADAYGSFPVTLSWTADSNNPNQLSQAAQTIQSRYNIVQQGATVYRLADAVNVFFSSGENGSVNAVWFSGGNDSGGEQAFQSGASVSTASDVKFTAVPNEGFVVEKWTVDGQVQTDGIEKFESGGQTLTLDLGGRTQEVRVEVTFTNSHNQIQFGTSGNGSVTAKDGSGNPVTTGDKVAHGATVTFTAVPDDGYMVASWTVNNQTYTWATGESYREDVLTLKNISRNYEVSVQFAEKKTVQVIIGDTVDSDEAVTSAASVEVKQWDGTVLQPENGAYTVQQDDSLVLTAVMQGGSDNTRVTEWQSSTDGTSWSAIPGSGGQESITIHNFSGEKFYIRVKVSTAQSYRLSWQILMDGTEAPTEANAALTATSSGLALTSGDAQAAYTQVDFSLALNDAYYVVGWSSNVTANDKTAVLNSLNGDTNVTVTIDKKPVLTIKSETGGMVEVKGTVNGVPDTTVNHGGYVDYGTAITVTLKPAVGYEVGTLQGNLTVSYTDGDGKTTDDKSYTVRSVTSDWTVAQAWKELDTYEIDFSVVDTGTGTNGTLSAAVDRKGLDGYKVEGFTSSGTVYRDSSVTFTAQPASGYRVQEWKVNGEVQKNGDFNNISTTLTLTPTQATEVTVQYMEVGNKITAVAGSNGAITGAQTSTTDELEHITSGFILAEGASVTFTATPNTGYEVQAWLVNGVPVAETGNIFTYVSEQDGAGAAITVLFQQVEYSVSWGASNGTVTATGYNESPADIRGGTQLTFTAVADASYTLTGWTVNGVEVTDGASGDTLTWTVPNGLAADPAVSSFDIRANFGRGGYAVTITQPANGTITANVPDLENVTGGSTVTFTAAPEEGYIVIGWIVDGVTTDSRSNTYPVQIENATTVSAVLVPSHYAVTYAVSDPDHGSIEVQGTEGNPVSIAYGESVTFTATPAQYYYVSGWQVDGAAQPNTANQSSFTLENVTKEQTVTAVIAPAVLYEVGYEAGANGSIQATANEEDLTLTPQQTKPILGGSTLVFTAQPAAGYMLDHWEVSIDGKQSFQTVTKENLEELGLTMTHPLSTVLTVNSLTSSFFVKAVYATYEGYDIPVNVTGYTVTDVQRIPADTTPDTEIRKGGDLIFTLKPDETYFSKLVINGFDCITGELVDENVPAVGCEEISAVLNEDGSYTVTVLNVTAELDLDIEIHQVFIADLEGYVIPQSLIDAGLDSVDAIKTKLDLQLTGSSETRAYYDITLKYWDDQTNAWVEVSEANFPAEGVDVVIPYPAGTDSKDSFRIVHMLTVEKDPLKPGDVEIISHTCQADGLHFHVDSLSPFAVSWTKYTPPTGGGMISTGYQILVSQPEHGRVSASLTSASAGEEITITVLPDSGYVAGGVSVTDSANAAVAVKDLGNGIYTFVMPASNVTVKAVLNCDGGENCPSRFYTDLNPGWWYHDAVDYVLVHGLMVGTDENIFSPETNLSRAMIVTILWRLEGKPETEEAIPFTDVPENDWYTEAVRWAASEGIVYGTSSTTYAPMDDLTREQMAAILYRYAEYKGYDVAVVSDLNQFVDADTVSDYARTAMSWANTKGLITGMSPTTLLPLENITRAQTASILMRFCQYFAK